jgi:mannosyltransferase OCH1-like enzyme
MDSHERAEFVKDHYSPEVFGSYSRLQVGASQADFWRILVLQKHGGVYLDMDASLVWPLGLIIRPELTELYLLHKSNVLSNYFLASVRDNPNLDRVINVILENIRQPTTRNIFLLTGPGALMKALDGRDIPKTHYQSTCHQGTFTNEFFQYVDHPQGKWIKHKTPILKE